MRRLRRSHATGAGRRGCCCSVQGPAPRRRRRCSNVAGSTSSGKAKGRSKQRGDLWMYAEARQESGSSAAASSSRTPPPCVPVVVSGRSPLWKLPYCRRPAHATSGDSSQFEWRPRQPGARSEGTNQQPCFSGPVNGFVERGSSCGRPVVTGEPFLSTLLNEFGHPGGGVIHPRWGRSMRLLQPAFASVPAGLIY